MEAAGSPHSQGSCCGVGRTADVWGLVQSECVLIASFSPMKIWRRLQLSTSVVLLAFWDFSQYLPDSAKQLLMQLGWGLLISILCPNLLLPLGRASPWFSESHSLCSPRTVRALCHSSCPRITTWSQLSTLPASTSGRDCSSIAITSYCRNMHCTCARLCYG